MGPGSGGHHGEVCTFCGRDLWEVDQYVVASGGVICDACIETCSRLVQKLPADAGRAVMLPPRVFGHPPDPGAIEEIQRALHTAFVESAHDPEWAAALEDGERLRPVSQAATPNTLRATSVRLDRVRFHRSREAEIRFTVSLGRQVSGGFSFVGSALRGRDRWQVSRDTWCNVVRHAGVQCPPRDVT